MSKNEDKKPSTQYELAQVSFKVGNYKDAIKKCDYALEDNPKDYLSLFLKGKSYSKMINNDPKNCYEANECYKKALESLNKAEVSEIKERELKRDISIEAANSFIELVNNNRKVYNASFKKEPKDINSKAWDKWCDENDVLEENFLSSLENAINTFELGTEVLSKFNDQSSINAIGHFMQYTLDYIEELLAYGKKSDDLKNKWYETLVALRITKKDNSIYSDKVASPLTLDRDFENDGKDLNAWKKETKKNLAEALNRYCAKQNISENKSLKNYAGVDLALEQREKVKTEQEIIDESINEIKAAKKNTKHLMISAAIAGICIFVGITCLTSKLYKSAILCVIAAFTAFPFIYKKMNNRRLANLMQLLTPIMLLIMALFS